MQPDTLEAARAALKALRESTASQCEETRVSEESPVPSAASQCEESEESEVSPSEPEVRLNVNRGVLMTVGMCHGYPFPPLLADPFRAWRLRNAELLVEQDGRRGHDVGGFCAEHRRPLSYPEQKRGACSWCVPVDPEREPEYWATHWRRFTERP